MKKILVIVINIVATVLFFMSNYQSMIANLNREALTEETYINSYIKSSTQLVDDLIMYGELYFSHTDKSDSKFYSLLKYNPKTNTYDLNAVQNTSNEKLVGNLNGIGQIPDTGIYRQEINLVLEFNKFFRAYSSKFKNIDWIYYISENNFICAYPWAPLSSVAYSENMKSMESYKIAIPINNPNKDRVWTPVYLDASGNETLVTLSKPLYCGNQFMGVVSINITNRFLRDAIKCENMFYLFDDNGTVLTTNQSINESKLTSINELLGISDYKFQSLKNIEKNSIQRFGDCYVYAARCQEAPWTMVTMMPMRKVFLKSGLYTLPLVLMGIFMVLSLYEIEKRKEAECELYSQATKDTLTGIYNRRFFMDVFNKEVSSAARLGHKLSLIILDIDNFKKINDTLGHSKGDEVLVNVSSVLRSNIRVNDILCRWGGEEFAILLPSTTIDCACQVAERIRKAVSEYNFEMLWQVTCSFGVASFKKNITSEELINNADKALYEAKNTGKNKVVCSQTE